jgi:pectin methylesterase-like acyl-CoA thioesterase
MNESIYELRVSRAASGAYPTISDALAATDQLYPDAEQAVTIHIDPGEYRERVEIHRPHVTLAGETADSVRIVGSLGAKMPSEDGSGVDGTLGTFRTYTVLVDADDVRLENLTIVNDAGDGREVGQAIALYADGDRLVVDACCITGRQDTLFLGPLPPREVKPGGFMGPKQFAPRRVGRQYFRRCRIEGDVDFIFGGARAYFEGCEIRSLNRDMDVNGYVTAASTPEGEPYGFVFHGCSFTAPDDVAPDSVYLGRPWREWAQTVLIDCWLGQHIKREGWWDWNKPAAHERARYVGTSLHGPAGDAAGWAPWTRELDATAAARYAREQVLAGADGWDPEGGDGDAVETASLSDSGRTVHIDIYYEDEPALRDRLKREGRSAAFKGATPGDFEAWQIATRDRLFDLLGLSIMDRAPIEVRELDRVQIAGGIVRTHAMLQVERDVWMPFYLLEPQTPKLDAHGCKRCYICPHGHQGAGAASVAGVTGVPAVDDAVRKFNYDYGLRLARMGYVTVCPDARGWGSRRDWKGQGDDENSYLRGTCLNQARMAEPLGLTVAGLNAWDNMRLIDYLETRGDIAMDDLGCFGFSGGGYMTLHLAALDPRVRKAFVSGYLYGVGDSLLHLNGNCSCNYTPGLWRLLDMGDIASLVAPRPLLVQSCEEDHLNGVRGLKNVDEQLKIVCDAYELLGRRGGLRHEVCPGGHHLGVAHLAEDIEWLDSKVAECTRA